MENEINKNIESNVLIKIPVLKWGNFIKGWKKIMLILDEYYIHIMTLKSTFKKTNKITSITLQDVNIIDDNKKKQFQIITNNQKITIKTEN